MNIISASSSLSLYLSLSAPREWQWLKWMLRLSNTKQSEYISCFRENTKAIQVMHVSYKNLQEKCSWIFIRQRFFFFLALSHFPHRALCSSGKIGYIINLFMCILLIREKKNSEHNAKCRCFAISVFSLLPWLIHNLLLWCFFVFARESHTPNATRMRSFKLRNNHFRLLNANNGENRACKIQTNNIRKHVCICFRECI